MVIEGKELKESATNRQKKILKFFSINFHPLISKGAAGWEIGTILSNKDNADKWRRYLYLTKDFGYGADELLPFNKNDIETIVVPGDWDADKAVHEFYEEISAQIFASESPFDNPQPEIVFTDRAFCFTGKFDFGPRKACEELVKEKHGVLAKGVSQDLDYLVIGTQGSPTWKRGKYGSKIEKAIFLRRELGKPAIVSEDHCFSYI